MKNIHLLSTDKPSRLIIYSTLLNEFRLLDSPIEDWKHKQNIYITSDEEIKEGDWFKPLDGTNDIYKADKTWLAVINSSTSRKIILTTDRDLIADGVQVIDDEFLEWFVKNPSCEFVDVKLNSFGECHGDDCSCFDDGDQKVCIFYYPDYKIIIPQEETKQETMTNYRLEGLERKAKEVAQELKEGGLLGGDLEVIGALLLIQYQGEDKRISELLTDINRVREEAEELLERLKQQEQ